MNNLYYPSHIYWNFNNIDFSPISNRTNDTFNFEYRLSTNVEIIDLKTSIRQSLINIYQKNLLPLSICISGADSEIIARESKFLSLSFELYFLDIWNINKKSLSKAQILADTLNTKLNVISLSKEEAFDVILKENYRKLQAKKPTYLCIPYLLNLIPKNTYIIGGEGDPQKSGPEYECLANKDGLYDGIPISITEVYYRQWAIENARPIEMYFYSSDPVLLKSYFYHPLIIKKNKRIDTRHLIDTLWPNLIFNYKTTNWEDSVESNYEIQKYLNSFQDNYTLRQLPNTVLAKI